jgi:hypothetical protein
MMKNNAFCRHSNSVWRYDFCHGQNDDFPKSTSQHACIVMRSIKHITPIVNKNQYKIFKFIFICHMIKLRNYF